MALFISTFVNKVDAKGRVSVPATFRAILTQQSQPGAILYPSFEGPYLEGVGYDRLEQIANGADSLNAFSPTLKKLGHRVFSKSTQLMWDDTGRILLPAPLREKAGITDQAAFVGMGKSFQVWNPETFEQFSFDEDDDEDFVIPLGPAPARGPDGGGGP